VLAESTTNVIHKSTKNFQNNYLRVPSPIVNAFKVKTNKIYPFPLPVLENKPFKTLEDYHFPLGLKM
jgi:hypothetical protein